MKHKPKLIFFGIAVRSAFSRYITLSIATGYIDRDPPQLEATDIRGYKPRPIYLAVALREIGFIEAQGSISSNPGNQAT